jgi:Ca-activated chloride channel family protein
MTLTSMTVWSLTPKGGFSAAVARANDLGPTTPGDVPVERWNFLDGTTLTVEGRLGHAHLAADRGGETYLFVDVKSAAGVVARETAPLNLAIAIDKSGSMVGKRLRNATQAAREMVERLRDGDAVSIVTYNDRSHLLVPSVAISASTRRDIVAKLEGMRADGETCISCAIDTAMGQLGGRDDMVKRIVVLSDGEPTVGARDEREFLSLAERARTMGCAISAIGVDVDYNEKIMSAIARGSNGRHSFVDNPAELAKLLEQEAQSLADTVATGAELRVELASGVEVLQVFDRSFRREGDALVVPLGSFSTNDDKTLLVKVRVPRGEYGDKPIANVRLRFRDLVTGEEGRCNGSLALLLRKDGQSSPLDPVVAGRVERSETARTLIEANRRFSRGEVSSAQRLVDTERKKLKARLEEAQRLAPAARKDEVQRDFEGQTAALDDASSAFASPPAPAPGGGPQEPVQSSRAGKSAVKRNHEKADAFTF